MLGPIHVAILELLYYLAYYPWACNDFRTRISTFYFVLTMYRKAALRWGDGRTCQRING